MANKFKRCDSHTTSMSRCQNCLSELDWNVYDDALPKGQSVFIHQCNVPDELGVKTLYYCSSECLSEATNKQPNRPGPQAPIP